MATSTVTKTVPSATEAEKLTVPINEEPKYTKILGDWQVEFKGFRWFTGPRPNTRYVPPEDFKIVRNTQDVPINSKGQTEMPQALTADYSDENPYEPYDNVDCAIRADPEKKALFAVIKERNDMTPVIGTEVKGCQLSSLSDAQKDELALWAAECGVLVFRDQDFVDQSPDS